MESKQILDKLNQARRALDSLSQVEIMDEWQFDNELNVWYLHLSIVIECETPYFPQKSQWFFVVGSEYPKGKIKVYPDVENSITVTLYHQANNSKIERNGLWRKGALCLEVNTIPNFQSEPYSVGNLSRHILNLNNIGEFKELSVCNYLNSLNPHANVKVINDTLSNDDSFKTNIDLDRYDVIVDCTGENNVLDILQSTNFKRTHIIASVSVGLGAKRLYVTLMNGNTFNFNAFYDLISPYLQAEKVLYDDYDLPRNGIGCWHPTFPGRSDDIWIAAATSVKVIENYIISKSQKTLSFIYEQKESDGIFESYEVVEKREDG